METMRELMSLIRENAKAVAILSKVTRLSEGSVDGIWAPVMAPNGLELSGAASLHRT